jgi:hypothetical protein
MPETAPPPLFCPASHPLCSDVLRTPVYCVAAGLVLCCAGSCGRHLRAIALGREASNLERLRLRRAEHRTTRCADPPFPPVPSHTLPLPHFRELITRSCRIRQLELILPPVRDLSTYIAACEHDLSAAPALFSPPHHQTLCARVIYWARPPKSPAMNVLKLQRYEADPVRLIIYLILTRRNRTGSFLSSSRTRSSPSPTHSSD